MLTPDPLFSATGRPVTGSPTSWSRAARREFRDDDVPLSPRPFKADVAEEPTGAGDLDAVPEHVHLHLSALRLRT